MLVAPQGSKNDRQGTSEGLARRVGEVGEGRALFVELAAMMLVAVHLLVGCSGDSSNSSKETHTTHTTTVEADPSGDTSEKGTATAETTMVGTGNNTSKQKTTASGLASGAENSHVIRLTHMGAAFKPVYSPDGQKIAFANYPGGLKVRNGTMIPQGVPELYVMNADGTDVTRIADLSQHAEMIECLSEEWAFSPDGTRIVFSIAEEKEISCFAKPDIYVADIDGSNLHNLTNSPSDDRDPSWSPDGEKIAFEKVLVRRGRGDRMISGIYSIDPDGTNLSSLSNDGSSPTFSPTDEKIAFMANRWGFYVMNADGTNVTRLPIPKGIHHYSPRFSPDGDQIAFAGLDNIYVINADGSHLRPVITTGSPIDPGALLYFVFSPDGKWIAYSNRIKRNDEIYAVNTDGSTTQINLTNNASANDFHPTFSPDGKKMAFESTSYDDSGKLVSEIYLMSFH